MAASGSDTLTMPSPLHDAAKIGDIDTVRQLLESKTCAVNERTWRNIWGSVYGGTPLHYAAEGGHCDVASLLIQHGADPCSTDRRGLTPLHYAAIGGHCDVAALFIQHGADPCSTNNCGYTPLHYAAGFGHCDVVAILIQHGADPSSTDQFDIKPSDLARCAGKGDIHILLKKFEGDHIQEFMITRTLEHVSAEMNLDDFFLPTDGINNNFPAEVQKQKVQRLKIWANSNNFKTIQGIKAGLTAQGREKLCVIAAEHYATVAKEIIDMSRERYESLCEDLSTAQLMFQDHTPPALETQSQEISMELESYQYDVFLIHSGEDKAKVEEVLEQLEALGIRCCYAPRDFLPGRSILSCINDAVDLSKCTVVMVSENFMKSTWCQHERDLAEVKAKDTEGYSVIPVLLDFKPSDLPSCYKVRKFILADSQDFIPTLVKAIEGPTADPPYGQLRTGYDSMKQEVERHKIELQEKNRQLEDSNALIRQLRAELEAATLSN